MPITQDAIDEPNETVNLALTAATGGATLGTQNTAVLTITDDDPAPAAGAIQFSAATYSVGESGNAAITIARTGGSSGSISATFNTSNGTATAGQDYTATTGVTVTFANGDAANKTVNVPILTDTIDEPNETVNLALSGSSVGAQNAAVLTITDDDPAPAAGSLQFSAAIYSVGEAGPTAAITVMRTGGTSGAVSATFAASNGTATAGQDYTAINTAVNFANGDGATKTVNVPITQDTIDEPNETVNLALTAATGGATLGSQSSAVLTITDDDPAPTAAGSLQFSAATFTVGESRSDGCHHRHP